MDKLKKYKQAGKYLFHGSPEGNIELFTPRQASSFGKPDGLPAVHASSEIEPAIFMAILGGRHVEAGWDDEFSGFGFYATDRALQEARQKNWMGYVYILPSASFVERRHLEWASSTQITAIDKIKVTINDLSPVKIMTVSEFDKYLTSHRPA
ncbi:MAG: hypothetical protein ACHQUB_03695 [Candidatus Saccharimonadia bacterium]